MPKNPATGGASLGRKRGPPPKDVTFKLRPEGHTDLLPLAEAAQVMASLSLSFHLCEMGVLAGLPYGVSVGLRRHDTAKPRPDGVKCLADMSYDITLPGQWEPDGPL